MAIQRIYDRDIQDAVKELQYNRATPSSDISTAQGTEIAADTVGTAAQAYGSGNIYEALAKMAAAQAANATQQQGTKTIDDPPLTAEERRNKEQSGQLGGVAGGLAGSLAGSQVGGAVGGVPGAIIGGVIGALGTMIGTGAGRAAGSKKGTWYEAAFGR